MTTVKTLSYKQENESRSHVTFRLLPVEMKTTLERRSRFEIIWNRDNDTTNQSALNKTNSEQIVIMKECFNLFGTNESSKCQYTL